ncbi:MAG TPA: ABC transporter ATP-binding protein [Bryobacteraceae bacterium]|nr:ABC transporter ATP-binding protein [Bryobacteraceae bacterium]
MPSLAIRVQNVQKVFRKRKGLLHRKIREQHALKGITFEVQQGEAYGLLGPNGSGKSTLIRILSTLLLPDGGDIEILGLHLPEHEREVRERVGRVSVDAAFYKKLSARENLLYTAFLYGFEKADAERKALDILKRLGQDASRFDDPLEEMSRGMQQKVSIARALLVNPPLLLLDEPTTGLDPKSKQEVQRFIEDLRRREGTTILLTTHDMDEAERLCDRIGILTRGQLVAEGTSDELKVQAGADNLEAVFLKVVGESFEEAEKEVAIE